MSDGAENAANSDAKQRRRAGGRPFTKGTSGNPAGKPPGTRHRATLLAEKLIDGQAEGVVNKAVQLALDGDSTALRIVMDRIVPPRKDRPINFKLPPLVTIADATAAMTCITAAAAAGELTPNEASDFARLIEAHLRTLEAADLAARVTALEVRDGLAERLDDAIRRAKAEDAAKLAEPPRPTRARSSVDKSQLPTRI